MSDGEARPKTFVELVDERLMQAHEEAKAQMTSWLEGQ